MPKPKSLLDAFKDKYIPDLQTGCWVWMGASNGRYGLIWRSPKFVMAHRVAYELYKGSIPPGLYVCHTCDVTFCVNPEHLFIGTQSDNMKDMISKGRKVLNPNAGSHGKHAKGECNGSNKYSAEMIHDMRRIYDSGACKNIAAIARCFRVSESQVRRIIHRQSWRHLP